MMDPRVRLPRSARHQGAVAAPTYRADPELDSLIFPSACAVASDTQGHRQGPRAWRRLALLCVGFQRFASAEKNGTRHECDMDQPSSSELNLIQDPETGLALLAKRPPEQEWDRLFWQNQFTLWRHWRAGDMQAVSHAVTCCAFYK